MRFESFFFQTGGKIVFQLERDVRVLGGIFGYLDNRDVTHGKLFPFSRADQFLDPYCFIFKVCFGEVVHTVTQFGIQKVVGDHRVE